MRNTVSPFPVTATGRISGLIEPGDWILRTGARRTWHPNPQARLFLKPLLTRPGLSAVYPIRQFLPAKVRLFIDYRAEVYGPVPYWER